jgi:cell division protein FtsL
LVAAAVVVYDVKYSATYEAQKVARLNNEIHQEREKIAALKAEWSVLSAPERVQRLATKYLGMKPLPVSHIGGFASLPERVTISGDPIGDIINSLDKNGSDPIKNIIEKLESTRLEEPETTGSIKPAEPADAEPIDATELPEPTGTIGGGEEEPEPAQ